MMSRTSIISLKRFGLTMAQAVSALLNDGWALCYENAFTTVKGPPYLTVPEVLTKTMPDGSFYVVRMVGDILLVSIEQK